MIESKYGRNGYTRTEYLNIFHKELMFQKRGVRQRTFMLSMLYMNSKTQDNLDAYRLCNELRKRSKVKINLDSNKESVLLS